MSQGGTLGVGGATGGAESDAGNSGGASIGGMNGGSTGTESGGAISTGGGLQITTGGVSSRTLALQWGAPVALTRLTQLLAAPSGEVFLAGWTQGAIAPSGLYGATDALIAKINADRTLAWVRQVGQSGGAFTGIEVKAWDAALTREGDIVIAGLVNGRGTFRGQTLTATFTAYVAKLSSEGDEVWLRLLGGTDGATEIMGVEVLGDDSIVVAGSSSASLLVDQPGLGGEDVFLAWYTTAGEFVRVRRYGDTGEQYPTAFSHADSSLFFVNQQVSQQNGASTGIDLVRTDSVGNIERTLPFDSPERTLVAGLAKSNDGICAAVSVRTNSSDAGPGADIDLRCYSRDLVQLSSTRRGVPGATALAATVTCSTTDTCALGGLVASSFEGEVVEANNDAFAATFGPNRTLIASRHFGPRPVSETTHAHVSAAVYAADGALFVGGEVGGALFTPQVGPVDLFVSALNPDTLEYF